MRFCIDGHELTNAVLRNAFSGVNARVNAGFVNNPKPAEYYFATARSRSTTTSSGHMMIPPYERTGMIPCEKLRGSINEIPLHWSIPVRGKN